MLIFSVQVGIKAFVLMVIEDWFGVRIGLVCKKVKVDSKVGYIGRLGMRLLLRVLMIWSLCFC